MTDRFKNEHFANVVDQVDVCPEGLAIVLDIPEAEINAWLALEQEPPKWFENYLSLVLSLNRISRICYGEVGNPYD